MSYDVSVGRKGFNMTSNIAPLLYAHIPDTGMPFPTTIRGWAASSAGAAFVYGFLAFGPIILEGASNALRGL